MPFSGCQDWQDSCCFSPFTLNRRMSFYYLFTFLLLIFQAYCFFMMSPILVGSPNNFDHVSNFYSKVNAPNWNPNRNGNLTYKQPERRNNVKKRVFNLLYIFITLDYYICIDSLAVMYVIDDRKWKWYVIFIEWGF